jgi:aspartate aminotransferase
VATVASHTASLGGSGIRAIAELVWHHPGPVIPLHLGQPDQPLSAHVADALHRAVANGDTGYAPSRGIPELLAAIRSRVPAGDVVVTAGATQAIHLALAAVLEAGDEVLIPDPGWPNYRMAAQCLQARAVPYPVTAGQPDIEALHALVGPRTRVLILNSPSNPLGTVLPGPSIRDVVEFALRHDLWLLSDECYEAFAEDHTSPLALDPARVLVCGSFSKTYAMTGLRVGYLIGPPRVIDVCTRMQESMLACVNTPAQHAALAALSGTQEPVAAARRGYAERRATAVETLAKAGLAHVSPRGGIYVWTAIAGGAPVDDAAFARRLLCETGVAGVPGSAFGARGRGWLRLSLTTGNAAIRTGIERLAAATEESR